MSILEKGKEYFRKGMSKWIAMARRIQQEFERGVTDAMGMVGSRIRKEPVKMRKITIGYGYWAGNHFIKEWYAKQTIVLVDAVSEGIKKLLNIGTCIAVNDEREVEYEGTKDLISVQFRYSSENFLKENMTIVVTDIGVIIKIPVVIEEGSRKGELEYKRHFCAFHKNYTYDRQKDYGMAEYELASFTASSLREGNPIYCRSDLADAYFDKLNEESVGLFDDYIGKKVSGESIVKAGNRSTLLHTPGIPYKMSLSKYGIAMYLGKLGGETNKTDGASYVSDKLISDICGMNINSVKASFLQTRTNALKTASVVMNGPALYTLIEEMAKEMGVEIVRVKRFEDITKSMYGKFVLVGNPKHIDLFSDLSGFKFIPKVTRTSEEYPEGYVDFMILQVAHVSKANINKQIHQFLMEYGEEFKKVYMPIVREHFMNKIRHLGFGLDSEDAKNTITGIDIKRVGDNKNYLTSDLTKISPLMNVDSYSQKSISSITVKAFNKELTDLKFNVEGGYYHGTPAIESWLNKTPILKEGEIFINNKHLENKDVVVIRNPRNSGGEYYAARILPLVEIIDRIDKLNIGEKLKDIYKRFYAEISPAAVVVTGSDDFKNKTGGSDFDFDGFTIIWDERILPLLKAPKSFAVNIKKDNAETVYYTPKSVKEVMQIGFLIAMTTGNTPIGSLAIQGSVVKSILSCSAELQDMIFEELFSNYNPESVELKHAYARRFESDCSIGEKEVKNAMQDFYEYKQNRESVIAFLKDVESMYISVIGRTIDSAKDGSKVTDPLGEIMLLGKVGQFYRKTTSYITFDRLKDEFSSVIVDKEYDVELRGKFKTKSKFYISDPLYQLVIKLIPEITEELNKGRKELKNQLPEVDAQEVNKMIDKYFLLSSGKENGVRYLLNQVNNVHSDIYSVRNVKVEYQNGVGATLKDFTAPYLAGTYRFFLDAAGVPPEQRYSLAKSVYGLMETTAYTEYLREEAINYALLLPGAHTEIKEYVYPLHLFALGGPNEFVDGVSEEFACTTYKFNGTFDVQEEGGRFFFKVQIEDEVKIPRFEETDKKIMFRILNRRIPMGYSEVPNFREKVQNAIEQKSEVFIHIEPKDGADVPSMSERLGDYLYTLDEDGKEVRLCRIEYYFKKDTEDKEYPYVDMPVLKQLMIDPKTGKKRKLVIDQLISEVKAGGISMYHVDLVLARFID